MFTAFDELVVVVVRGELPVLDPIDGGAANLDRACLAKDRDRTLEVARIGEHRDFDRSQRARAELEHGDPRVLRLDPARECRGLGHHALDRPDEPLNQIDVVRCLVHERAAVELPGTPPGRLVIVLLWPRPSDRAVGHVDPAEASLVDGASQELHGRVEPVLLHNEQMDTGRVAGMYELVGRRQRDGHRLLDDDMLPRARGEHALLGVQSRRRRDADDFAGGVRQHLLVGSKPRDGLLLPGLARAIRIGVADGTECQTRHAAERLEVILADAPAPDERDAKGRWCRHPASPAGAIPAPRRTYCVPHPLQAPSPVSSRRTPHAHVHPMRRAGTPATSA